MEERIRNYIQSKDLFNRTDKLLLAISGGIDSVVLFHLLKGLGYDISFAHCNFKLRGKESDEDEQFVRDLGKSFSIPTFINICDAQEYSNKYNKSIQESARELRYSWFNDLCNEKGYHSIVVAHHFDDNLETLLINLSRGSGLGGIKGIPISNELISRPLIFASRKEIEQYAKQNSIDYREDSSNDSLKYLRNEIRHRLVPQIRDILDPNNSSLKKSMQYLWEDSLVMENLLNEKRDKLIKSENGISYISISSIKKLIPNSVWLYYLLKPFNFNRSICEDIVNSIDTEQSGKLFTSNNYRLIIDREQLIIKEATPYTNEEYLLNDSDSYLNKPLRFSINKIERFANFELKTESTKAIFDYDKLSFPLKIRRWKKGDKFKPFGMNGNRLLSDFFIDKKLNLFEKENIWLVLSNNDIIWIVGMRTSDKYKVTKNSKRLFQISLKS